MFFNSPATYSQQFAFSADGLCNMISKNSRQNMQLEDDLNYDLDYEYYEGHAHLLKRAGERYYRYDENGNLICEQDRDFDLTDGTEAVEYHAVTKEAGDVYSTDYAWAAVRDSSAGKTEDDRFYKRTFEWNEDNMLIATTDNEYVTNYVYGADGERAVKKSKAGETLYFNKFFSHRFLGSIQWEAGRMSKHIFLGNERIATKVHELSDSPDYDKTDTRVEKENIYFYHSDHLGSAQTVTNGEGQLYERLEYTPYGEVWLDESAAYVAGRNDFKTPFRFTAKELDEETGLYYYGARYLDPKYSRWISTDPALAEYIPSAPINDEAKKRNQNLPGMGGIFNTTNCGLYHYAANNPVRYVDPDGRSDEDNDNWSKPCFFIGISTNATGPLIAAGFSAGEYFVPQNSKDPKFYILLTMYATSSNPITKMIYHSLLIKQSDSYGVVDDILNAGTGFGLSASAGISIGMFKSYDDMAGFFNDTGFSVSIGFVSIGVDGIINQNAEFVGFVGTLGVGIGSFLEFHSKFGNSFVLGE